MKGSVLTKQVLAWVVAIITATSTNGFSYSSSGVTRGCRGRGIPTESRGFSNNRIRDDGTIHRQEHHADHHSRSSLLAGRADFSSSQRRSHHHTSFGGDGMNQSSSYLSTLQLQALPPASSSVVSLSGEVHEESTKPPFWLILWRFTRPHTLIGSAVAIPCIHLLAAPNIRSCLSMRMMSSLCFAMVPALLMNLYITGLNQITDVEIDRVNKPFLPMATGDLSHNTAVTVVVVSLLASLLMAALSGTGGSSGLNVALYGSAILGTMYSLPPFRLKRFPLLAAFCIVAVRGTIINAGFYAHARTAAFGTTGHGVLHCLTTDARCALSSLFFGVFGIVIALMKDVPDVEGDEAADIRTLSVRVGRTAVFHTMRRLVSVLFYAFGLGFAAAGVRTTSSLYTASARAGVATVAAIFGIKARQKGKRVDAEDSGQVYTYYMYLWKLFYASYLALPFAK